MWLVLIVTSGAARDDAQHPTDGDSTPPDYKVVFWYRRADPLSSMRDQVYDVRKGQYTATVAKWLEMMLAAHPDYDAYAKDFRVDPEQAATEKKQLATMVLQEYLAKGGPGNGCGVRDEQGIYGHGGLSSLTAPRRSPGLTEPAFRSDASAYSRGSGFMNSPGANRPAPIAVPPGPFPYPYARPHP
jgi:hypothetical protein